MKFSVLISISPNERANNLECSINSLTNQILQPNEIVIIKDGQLPQELVNILNDYKLRRPDLFNIIGFEQNKGLGVALNEGLLNCSYNIVARMDSDDICVPDRFKLQIQYLQDNPHIDIVGSYIAEFYQSIDNITGYRNVPLNDNDIKAFAKWRNPLNHMSVMFRKNAVLKAGNYSDMRHIQDYELWIRMIKSGCRFANLPLVLVFARTIQSDKKYNLNYFKYELIIQFKLYKLGFVNHFELVRNIVLRLILRLSQYNLGSILYLKFLRTNERISTSKNITVEKQYNVFK